MIKIATLTDTLNEAADKWVSNLVWLDPILNPNPSYDELNKLFRQLSSIYEAGTNWAEAIGMMSEEVENKKLALALKIIQQDMVDEGVTLADAFEMHDMFPSFCIEALRAGQESDGVADQLREIGKFLKQRQKIEKGIQKALRPIKVMSIGVLFSIYMLTTMIVPQIATMYKDVHAELPWFTVIEMAIFRVLLDYIYIPIILIPFIPYVWKKIKKKYPLLIGKMMFKLPLYKKFYYFEIQYLFAKLMSLYMKNGNNPTQALLLTSNVINNHLVKSVLEYVHYQVMDGVELAKALTNANQNKILSNVTISYIKTSETTGQSDIVGLLDSAAADFEDSRAEELENFRENIYSLGIFLCLTAMVIIVGSLYYPQVMLFKKIG